jgi:hypothetical protein
LSKRGVVLSALNKLNTFRDIDVKLLIRVEGFIFAGIVTKIKKVYDSQIGRDRRWAMGVTVEGTIFEEPLDRKNPKTGRLEDAVQRETEFMIITARKSNDSSDADENFSWLPHQFNLDRMKMVEDNVEALQRVNLRMDEQHRADRKRMEITEHDASNTNEQNKNMREILYHTTKKLNEFEMETQGLYTLLQRLRAHGLEVEGELSVDLARALEKGKERGISAHELRMKKLTEDEVERQQLRASFPLADMESMKSMIDDSVEKSVDKKTAGLKQQSQNKQKARPPLVKEEEEEPEESSGGGDV